jgi:cell division transport system permease protein
MLLDASGMERIPVNLELTLRPDLLERQKAIEVGEGLRKLSGVGDVVVDHERMDSLIKGARSIRSALAGFGLILLVVAAFSTGTVVRTSVMSREEEINIMRLVGATEFYVLAPLLLEGAILGAIGAALAAGTLWAAWLPLSMGKFDVSPFIVELARLVFFSPKNLAVLGGTGLATGALGALWGFRGARRDKRGSGQ